MPDIGEYVKARLRRHLDNVLAEKRSIIEAAAGRCESPIEEMMLVGLCLMPTPVYHDHALMRFGVGDTWPAVAYTVDKFDQKAFDWLVGDGETVVLYIQVPVLEYRADFLIVAKLAGHVVKVVVECDGHDFHERTKEQAQRDRKRDRKMQAAGYTVFRFTGSEIYRDTDRCVNEIFLFLDDVARK